MDERKSDIFSGIVLFGLSILIFVNASGIQQRLPVGLDSGVFPEIASILLAFLSAIVVLRALLRPQEDSDVHPLDKRGLAAVGLSLCLVLGYIIGVGVLGFVAATVIYLPLQFFALSPAGERRWPAFIIVSVVTTAVIYSAFVFGFRLILPSGMFI
jgi:putative tricarboxylic transport membrane protein